MGGCRASSTSPTSTRSTERRGGGLAAAREPAREPCGGNADRSRRRRGVPAAGRADGLHRLVFNVGHGQYTDPDGRAFDRYIVRHPGAVAVVAVDAGGLATCVRQLRTAVWRQVLEIPAGTCDVDGEPLEATARRELAEEAGLGGGPLGATGGRCTTHRASATS